MKKDTLKLKYPRTTLLLLLGIFIVLLYAHDVRNCVEQKGKCAWEYTHIARLATFLSPDDAGLRLAIGNYYFGGSKDYDVDRAQAYFQKTIELDPARLSAHYQLARTFFIQGDFFRAEQEINKELELHPDYWHSYYIRGLIRGYSNDLPGAAEDFATFLTYKPESWAGHNDLAWVYFRKGDYEKVKEAASRGLLHAPENPWLNNSLGIALINLGEKEEAAVALKKAQVAAAAMTTEQWGRAYPGNNPAVYGEGLEAMRDSIEENLLLLETVDGPAE